MIESEAFNFVIAAIKEVGFPIVAFFLMWYMSNSTIKKNTEAINNIAKKFNGDK